MITATSLGELAGHGIRKAAVACGVFDGVHCGHQEIIAALLAHCGVAGAVPVMLTFEPHPRALLTPHNPPPRLTLPGQKLELFARYGAEAAIVVPFDRTVAALAPDQFLDQFLLHKEVALEALCVGRDWRFGRGGAAGVEYLLEKGAAANFQVLAVDELWMDGLEVASTEIRRALACGDLAMANRHLGREYTIAGTVSHGRGLGSDLLGCPTANIIPAGQMLPADGVYAVHATLDGPRIPGAAYVGTSPTIKQGNRERVLETHLFGFHENLYGRELSVAFAQRIRGDRKFASVQELAAHMRRDIEHVRHLLGV